MTRRRGRRRWHGLAWWLLFVAAPTVLPTGDGGLPEPDLSDTGGGTVVDDSDTWPELPPVVVVQTFPEPMAP